MALENSLSSDSTESISSVQSNAWGFGREEQTGQISTASPLHIDTDF